MNIQAPALALNSYAPARSSQNPAAREAGPADSFTASSAADPNTCSATIIYDSGGRTMPGDPTLVGSWDKKGHYTNDWKDSAIPMQPAGDGRWKATVKLDPSQNFQWDVQARGKSAIFSEEPPTLQATPGQVKVEVSPSTFTDMGVTRDGPDARIRFWSPKAAQVQLLVWDQPDAQPHAIPLQSDPQGFWNGQAAGQWAALDGKSYAFSVTSPEGGTSLHTDPYARQVEGQLRGVSYTYLNQAGHEENKFYKESDGKSPIPFYRFEVQQEPDAQNVFLRLYDKNGQPVSRDALQQLMGQDGQSQVHTSGNPFWGDHCDADGRIALQREGPDGWATLLDHPDKLQGLTYRFEVWKNDALDGDQNHDRQLSEAEARKTSFNDPYDNRLQDVDSQRLGVIHSDEYAWKNPSPNIDPKKAVIYQLHVGSFMGQAGNARRSTFKDLCDRLDYFKELGVNTLEMLPVNPFEGMRDWGYIGTNSTAVAEQYGFSDEQGRWISGPEALKRFVDEAHGRGMAVMGDMVYNHMGGDYNSLWKVDGNSNSYFDWGPDGNKGTPWGPMPAFNQTPVRQFVIDSAMAQLDDYHMDGLRFDFTHLIHANEGGGLAGWTMLRELTRQAHFFHPNAFLAAEEFPNDPILTTPPGPHLQGGAGFDAVWNTEFQHRLVHDNDNPSILQQAASGQWTNIDKFMGHLVYHPGFGSEQNSVTVISNHDEVGNADRTINVANNFQSGPPNGWARSAARATFGVGMLSPGEPIFFQGEESLASNPFKWGIPSTWDTGWSWHDKPAGQLSPEDLDRRHHFDFCKDAIGLRTSSPAFSAEVPAQRVYTHNNDSVLAFSRQSGKDEFVVVSSLNHNPLTNYQLPLEAGKWQLVLDSDASQYGGSGLGKATVQGGPDTRLDLAPGSVLVYKKVG